MRTTVTIDDELYALAESAAGEQKPSRVIAAGLRALVAQNSAERLRALGGTSPDYKVAPRSQRLQVAETNETYPRPEL